jgi:hypothetical protein
MVTIPIIAHNNDFISCRQWRKITNTSRTILKVIGLEFNDYTFIAFLEWRVGRAVIVSSTFKVPGPPIKMNDAIAAIVKVRFAEGIKAWFGVLIIKDHINCPAAAFLGSRSRCCRNQHEP